MSDWSDGYRAALDNALSFATSRRLLTEPLAAMFADMRQDALVIGHEGDLSLQKRKLRAAREAMPLFEGVSDA